MLSYDRPTINLQLVNDRGEQSYWASIYANWQFDAPREYELFRTIWLDRPNPALIRPEQIAVHHEERDRADIVRLIRQYSRQGYEIASRLDIESALSRLHAAGSTCVEAYVHDHGGWLRAGKIKYRALSEKELDALVDEALHATKHELLEIRTNIRRINKEKTMAAQA